MAANLEVTDAQLTKFYICDTDVDLGDATKIKTALATSGQTKRIAYLEDLGDFTKTRETNAFLESGSGQRRKRAKRDV